MREEHPVVKHRDRDPKVIWHAYDKDDTPLNPEARKLGGHWVMAVFDETPGIGANFAFYTSTDMCILLHIHTQCCHAQLADQLDLHGEVL